ncbi:MAG: IS5 family transposase [Nitrospirae bacterium]|nr:IS5 family transposase [Nitrospirota bacterium]MBF0535803.1 IS5 family transposase [Nitrospirota bacterium]MBF0617732.1 IS5 family transposase [Nitrospirota bacterium]
MSHKALNQLSFAGALIKTKAGLNQTLDEIDKKIDWKGFEKILKKLHSSNRGRPSYPPLMMLKCMLLQNWYNLSDYGLEESLYDRLSFRRFLGLELDEYAPDHSTISRFRDELVKDNLKEAMFLELERQLESLGLLLKKGTLIDASIISASVSKPRKNVDGTAAESPVDPDAQWTCKGKRRDYYGYKAHVSVDQDSGLIRKGILTKAKVDDGHMLKDMVMGDEKRVFGDKAYGSKSNKEFLSEQGIKDGLMTKGCYRRKLTEREKSRNKHLSRYRSAVERVFGTLKRSYGYTRVRYIGLLKNALHFSLLCLAFNLKKMNQLTMAEV